MSKSNIMDDANPYLHGNESIDEAIHRHYENPNEQTAADVLYAVYLRTKSNGQLMLPCDVNTDADGGTEFDFKMLELDENTCVLPAFTSTERLEEGPKTEAVSYFMESAFQSVLEAQDVGGVLINPWGESFLLTKGALSMLLRGSNGGAEKS